MKRTILVLLAAFASTVATGAEVSKDDFENATLISFMHIASEQKDQKAQNSLDKISQKMCGLEFSELSTGLIYGNSNNTKGTEQVAAELNEISKGDLSDKCRELIGSKFPKVIANVKALVTNPGKLAAALSQEIKNTQRLSASKKPPMSLIGLVPDVSREADVSSRAITANDALCQPFCLKIGGHNLQCSADYHGDGTLSLLTCYFGGDSSEGDNIAIFNVLEQGFSEKFGKPKTRQKYQVQNSFGAKFEAIDTKWIDESGNLLHLASRANQVDRGAFALKSVILRAREAVAAHKEKAGRKF